MFMGLPYPSMTLPLWHFNEARKHDFFVSKLSLKKPTLLFTCMIFHLQMNYRGHFP